MKSAKRLLRFYIVLSTLQRETFHWMKLLAIGKKVAGRCFEQYWNLKCTLNLYYILLNLIRLLKGSHRSTCKLQHKIVESLAFLILCKTSGWNDTVHNIVYRGKNKLLPVINDKQLYIQGIP